MIISTITNKVDLKNMVASDLIGVIIKINIQYEFFFVLYKSAIFWLFYKNQQFNTDKSLIFE